MNYIVFDTETTGLVSPEPTNLSKQPHIIEFAAIKLDEDLKPIDQIEFLCDPGIPLSAQITKITGLTDRDVRGQKKFAEYYKELVQFFLGVEGLVAHNLAFDRDMLNIELRRMDCSWKFPWPHQHICTVEATESLKGYRLNLAKLHKEATGEDFEDSHRAMADTQALVRCFEWLRKEKIL